MPVINPNALSMVVPEYPLDQIIGYHTGSITVGNGGSPSYATDVFAHGFGDSCYFQGVFSSDGGITWNDFGAEIPAAGPTFQTIGCNATVDTTNVNVYGINWTGANVTIQYKLYLLAKNTMNAAITPIPTTQALSFSSKFIFQQIVAKGSTSLTVTSGNTGEVVILHELGYVPFVRVFCYTTNAPNTVLPITYSPDTSLSFISALEGDGSATQVRLTSTSLTLFLDNTSSFSIGPMDLSYDYRIYK